MSFSSQKEEIGMYKIISIDDTTLVYYYWIKVMSTDGSPRYLNIMSPKDSIINKVKCKKELIVGENYIFDLTPMYMLMDKQFGEDSVYFSPNYAGNVERRGEILISTDYETYPYTTDNLSGLCYILDSPDGVMKKCR